MTDIVGRDEELAALASFLDGSAPAALLIEGDPGIGKTTLWRDATARAAAAGHRVLVASPTESETELPFATFGDLLSGAVDEVLDELPPPQRHALEVALLLDEPDTVPPDRRAIAVALLTALRKLARRRPLAIAVDDVQWLDAASRNALEFALRRVQDEDIKFLLAQRSDGGTVPPLGLDRLTEQLTFSRVHVGALTLGAIGELLRERFGLSLRRPTLTRIHDVSGGNPFYALELGAALLRGDVPLGGDELPIPASLGDLIRQRIAALPTEVTEALLVVAALSDATIATAASFLNGSPAELLRPAVEANVVGIDRDRIRFTHPLLRSVVYGNARAASRRDLHARLAALDLPLEERARHVALSAEETDTFKAQLLENAARSASLRGAPEAAAEFAEHSTRLTPVEDTRSRHRRLLLTGQNIWAAGDYDRGRAVLETAVADAPDVELKAEALLLLARNPRNIAESRQLCEQALAVVPPEAPVHVDILVYLAQLCYVLAESETALAHVRSAVDVARAIHDPTREAGAGALRSWLVGITGGGWDLETLRRGAALELATYANPPGDGIAYICGLALMWTDQLDDACALLGEMESRAREAGDVTRIEVLNSLAQAEFRSGMTTRALAHFDECVELAQQFGQEELLASAEVPRALVLAAVGRVDEAREACEWVSGVAERISERLMHIRIAVVLGFLESSLGNAAAASAALDRGLEVMRAYGIKDPAPYPVYSLAIDAFAETGELGRADELTMFLEQFAAEHPRPRVLVYAHRCRAVLHAARDELEEALGSLERAVVELEKLPVPFEHALTFLWLGRIQRRARQRRTARESLRRAAAIFEELGFPLWLDRTREELQRIGGRTASPDELTETERRVAALVAEGRTNKEVAAELVVTVRAVEANLSRIYSKLGVRSRAELAAKHVDFHIPTTKRP